MPAHDMNPDCGPLGRPFLDNAGLLQVQLRKARPEGRGPGGGGVQTNGLFAVRYFTPIRREIKFRLFSASWQLTQVAGLAGGREAFPPLATCSLPGP